ncbi:hypothetical protein EDC40_101205 [Aminobacter aminovorans]|uniref:Uncharacterized protein n=1 Tax=Aminobacter aminovorans TaxID=83263 RepID=A0A380WP23_AMIAI|nr:transposase [Aminobacter aminovorans]TCS29890.1 hypothetical protein EDC40_101205 [Aminobacter aminovorans]SUU90739.1 Uncharacterised protein [Aminobacter aminovorans]
MRLSLDDIKTAEPGNWPSLPERMFGPPINRGTEMPDHPEVRAAVDWFKSAMEPGEWEQRRKDAFFRFYQSLLGVSHDESKGRYFDTKDSFAWYLFLAEAFIDHPWNFEPMFGSRVVPVFASLGRNLPLIANLDNIGERISRIVGPEKGQPNGPIFELLVAAAYRRHGAKVSFRPEQRGIARSWDLDVKFPRKRYAVECKRMETGEYNERERTRMRALWREACSLVTSEGWSVFCDVDFRIPLEDVPDDYFLRKALEWHTSRLPSLLWTDSISHGVIGELDLEPIRSVFQAGDEVLSAGTRIQELLTGRYVRYANIIQVGHFQHGMSPRFVSDCRQAVVLRWKSSSEKAISGKARDVFRKLVEAHAQLPDDMDSIVHIGLEALEDETVERARFRKIMENTEGFDTKGKPLRFVYTHYFMPESPPNDSWAFDETAQWRRLTGRQRRPLLHPHLVLPEGMEVLPGPFWSV